MTRECDVLSAHLAGRRCPAEVARRYQAAVQEVGLDLSPGERRIWNACLRARPLVSCLDAGVSLCDRRGAVRRRLLVMFALLEACPETADCFLFATPTPLGWMRMLADAVTAPLAVVAGIPLGLACKVSARRADAGAHVAP